MKIRDCMKQIVYSISTQATIRQAAEIMVENHIGLVPVIDEARILKGVVGLRELLTLELPDFYNLVADFDFVHDFGAVEHTRPTREQLERPVISIMQPAISVEETCGLLRAYAIMLKHNLHDLPVITASHELIGIASRVDIGTAILALWKNIGTA